MTIATIRPVIRSTALAFLTTTARKAARESLAIALIVALQGNIAPAQELDSSTLQKEAAQATQKTVPDANATPAPPQPTASQDQRPAPTPAQSQQQWNQPPAASQPPPAGQAAGMFTVPAGTKLPLGLLRPISVRSSDPVADVYLQITFPVTVGSQMLIPPGAYIQGVIQKTIPRPRGSAGPGFEMRFANLIFPTGYTVPIAGTVSVLRTTAHALPPGDKEVQPVAALTAADSTERRLPRVDAEGQPLPAMAAVGSTPPPLPPLPKSPFGNTPRNIFIGMGVAAAVGTIAVFALNHSHRNDLNMEAGTPLEMVLLSPLQLDPERVTAAVRQYSAQVAIAPPVIVQPPKPPKMCYAPGSPGTPDTVIPGSPGTPDTVIPGVNGSPDIVIPGTPRTPDTVIPGTPGTPSSTYPCPK